MKQGFLTALFWVSAQYLLAQVPTNCDIIVSNDTLVCSGSPVELKRITLPMQSWQGILNGGLQSGLMAYFPFNNSTADATGRNVSIQTQQVGFDVDRFGNPAAAGKFSILNQSYLFVPSNANIEPTSYTLSTWFKTNSLQKGTLGSNDDQTIAIYTPDNWLKGPVYKHSLIVTDNSVFQTRQWTPATSWQDLQTPTGYIQVNQWYHAVTTYDAQTKEQRLYINGQLYSSRQSAFGYNGQLGLLIGASREQSSGQITQHFDGLLDDIALWNRPLTAADVAALYSGVPVTVEWSTGSQAETITVRPETTTKYYANASFQNFTCRDSVTIQVKQIDTALKVTGDTIACEGAIVRLGLTSAIGSFQWQRSDDGVNFTDMQDSIAAGIVVQNGNTISYYRVRVNNGGQCAPTITPIHAIAINANPPLPMIRDTIICTPGQVLLEATIPPGNITDWYVMNADNTYQLQAAGTLALPVNVVDKPIIRYLKSRNLASGCTSSKYQPVQAVLDKTPIPVVTGADAFCKGDSVLLIANMSTPLTWWLNKQVVTSKSGQSVFFSSPGNYQASLTTASGCIRMSAIKSIVQYELPLVRLDTISGTILCNSAVLPLQASGGLVYRWTFNDTPLSGANDAIFKADKPGDYQVKAVDVNGCVSLSSIVVKVKQQQPINFDFSFDTTCVGVPIRLNAIANGNALSALAFSWQINGVSYSGKSISPVFNAPGNIPIRLLANTVSCPGLVDTIQKTVVVQSQIKGIKYEPVNATINQQVLLEARPGASAYSWIPGIGLENARIRTPKAKLTGELTYTIQMTTAGKCLTVDTLLVRVFKQVDILVPKAFTPNYDGKNDFLFPVLVGLDRLIQFSVFDRWGNLVYLQKDNGNKGWDGTYRGRPAPAGIYIWMAEAAAIDGAIVRRNGNTMLIR
ncbi:MAG: hypothetical protein RLY85_2144 [Bacteroidota bacterium]|jgi:gliding motility-associated-like protein